MKKEELQKVVEELQEVKEAFETGEDNIKTLIQLASCMGDLRKYPKYFERTERTLEMIEEYQVYSKMDFIYVVERIIIMIKEDLENDENATVIEAIKKGYKDAKDIVSEAIPEDVKNKCGEAINKASTIGDGIANTVKQEMPKYAEKVEQLKGTPKKIERKIKSTLRNWLLSEDGEED